MAKRGRPRKQYTLDDLYNMYVKEYERASNIVRRRGYEPNKEMYEGDELGKRNLLSKYNFYRAYYLDEAKNKQKGMNISEPVDVEDKYELVGPNRKNIKEIVKRIAEHHVYYYDEHTADSLVDWFKEHNVKVRKYDARMRNFTQEQWDMIKEEYHFVKDELNLSKAAAGGWVSQYVFGSE